MNEKDTLRLFDLALAREIVRMDHTELRNFVESRAEQLRGMKKKHSFFVLPHGCPTKRTTAMVFDEFFNEDPAEVRQSLIHDLCYQGEPFEINYHARCGYLDHPSSLYENPATDEPTCGRALSSLDLFPWPKDSEAYDWEKRFDVLDRDHIRLMTEALRHNRSKVSTEDYTKQLLTLRSMEQTLDAEPNLRAAYIYDR